MAEKTDQELVYQYLKGDGQSLEILIKRYLKPLYNFVYYYINGANEAEDITQEAFIRAWKNLKKFDRQRSFKTWIFSIAKNAALDWLKKKKTIPFSDLDNKEREDGFIATLADPAPLPSELLERADLAQMLNSALEKLSPQYRQVLLLHYNDHFTLQEIAEVLDQPLNTVKSQHRRGLIALRKILVEPF